MGIQGLILQTEGGVQWFLIAVTPGNPRGIEKTYGQGMGNTCGGWIAPWGDPQQHTMEA